MKLDGARVGMQQDPVSQVSLHAEAVQQISDGVFLAVMERGLGHVCAPWLKPKTCFAVVLIPRMPFTTQF